ncbi:hypothetical protein GS896_25535 [Rhodococcus hoagii]|nr:hypothetical protein [Prescottella equi]MBM4654131.1 hypothetical protein [Prescottella equi]MBM4719605.1 hypothetical protein [Prescottella equi]NKR23403.1 hypothetical protein [Prescottella equi]NKT55985.1 hypothetical protein [Prescottella equi]
MRRIVESVEVSVPVHLDRETFTERGTVCALGPSDRADSDGNGRVSISFGRHTSPESPWYGAEPTFNMSIDNASALRDALDACIRAARAAKTN